MDELDGFMVIKYYYTPSEKFGGKEYHKDVGYYNDLDHAIEGYNHILKKENREFKIVDVDDGNKLTDPVIARVTGATICTPIKSERID